MAFIQMALIKMVVIRIHIKFKYLLGLQFFFFLSILRVQPPPPHTAQWICKWVTEKKALIKDWRISVVMSLHKLTADALWWPNRLFFFSLVAPKRRQCVFNHNIRTGNDSRELSVCVLFKFTYHIISYFFGGKPVRACNWWILFTIRSISVII